MLLLAIFLQDDLLKMFTDDDLNYPSAEQTAATIDHISIGRPGLRSNLPCETIQHNYPNCLLIQIENNL